MCHIRALQLNLSASPFLILTARSFHIFTEYRCPKLLSYDVSIEFAFFQSVSPKLVKLIFLLENSVQQKQKRLSFSFVFFALLLFFCASFLFCYPLLSCSCILILPWVSIFLIWQPSFNANRASYNFVTSLYNLVIFHKTLNVWCRSAKAESF